MLPHQLCLSACTSVIHGHSDSSIIQLVNICKQTVCRCQGTYSISNECAVSAAADTHKSMMFAHLPYISMPVVQRVKHRQIEVIDFAQNCIINIFRHIATAYQLMTSRCQSNVLYYTRFSNKRFHKKKGFSKRKHWILI